MTSVIPGGIDCDLHPALPGLQSLLPYLSDYWADQVTNRGMVDLVSASYPLNSPITSRPDWRPQSRQGRLGARRPDETRARSVRDEIRHLQSALRRADGVFGGHGDRVLLAR